MFLFEGHGDVRPLLEEAAGIVEDKPLVDAGRWEAVKATDDSLDIVYYRTTTSHLETSADSVSFDKLEVKADRVCIPSIPSRKKR